MSAAELSVAAPSAKSLWRNELRATLTLSWPLVLTNLAQTAMTATDVMLMGRLGPDALAAGALGANIYFLPLIFGLGFMLATQPMMATELGRRKHAVRDIRRTVRQGIWLAVLISLPVWVVLWHAEAILDAMGQDRRLTPMAGDYVRALQWAVLPFFAYIVLRSFISALERPRWALVVVLFAVLFNLIANWVLMFGNLGFPALGLAGSGWATTLSSTLMFLGLALVVLRAKKFRRYHLFGRFWRPDWPRLRALAKLGAPIAGMLLFEVSLFNAAALTMGLIDAVSLAAHAIAVQLASLSFMVPLGVGQAATVRVGLAFGAGDRDGIRRAGWTAYALGVGFMVLTALAMLFAPRLMIAGFLDLDDPVNLPVIEMTVTFLALAALFQVVDGAQAVGAGMLRGLHDTRVPMIYAAVGYWGIGMPLGLLLAFVAGLRGSGLWLGLCTGLAVVASLLLRRWLRRERLHTAPADAALAARPVHPSRERL